jgi:hypothetical protein
LQLQDIQTGDPLIVDVPCLPAHRLIAAGAEGVFAILRTWTVAGQNDNPDLLVVPGAQNGFGHLVNRFRTEGIADFRSVEGDACNAAANVKGNVFVLLHLSPFDQ